MVVCCWLWGVLVYCFGDFHVGFAVVEVVAECFGDFLVVR